MADISHKNQKKSTMERVTTAVVGAASKILHSNNEKSSKKKVTAVVVGAGNRGKNYASYATLYPDQLQIISVAEPRDYARNLMKQKYGLEAERCYRSWEDLCSVEKFADCAIVATQDQMHVGPAVSLAKLGYHILLEKPMAVTAEDCRAIYDACKKAGVILAVCHVLRYHPSVIKIKELIDSGAVGDVVNICHTEPVGFWHFAHSFVRGNWSQTSCSTFSLLAKCCHDVDLIYYWMGGQKCTRLSSFGSLKHFIHKQKPKGAVPLCRDCKVERTCPYSAKKIYLDSKLSRPSWPSSVVCDIEDSPDGYPAALEKALWAGPYGRCVYDSDNDVCDNQVVSFQFEGGATATLTMVAFTEAICERRTVVYGTHGEITMGDLSSNTVHYYDFRTQRRETIYCGDVGISHSWGHGGADFFTVKSFVNAVATCDQNFITTGPRVSLESHLLTFAAEHSRLTNSVVCPQDDPKWSVS